MRSPGSGGTDAADSGCQNRTYYFEVGPGEWRGAFGFRVTDWRRFLRASLGLRDRLLVVAMALTVRLFGRATITSAVTAHPDRGEAGVATNEIRISKFGITLYLLREEYRLDRNCRDATVVSEERFGPVAGLLESHKEYPAEVDPGPRATYHMPLLGAEWTGRYEPSDDHDRIDAELTCAWATASETIHRVE